MNIYSKGQLQVEYTPGLNVFYFVRTLGEPPSVAKIDHKTGDIVSFQHRNSDNWSRHEIQICLSAMANHLKKSLYMGCNLVAEYERKTVTDVKIGEKFTLVVGNGKVYRRIKPLGKLDTDLDIIEEETGFGVRFTADNLEVEIVSQ